VTLVYFRAYFKKDTQALPAQEREPVGGLRLCPQQAETAVRETGATRPEAEGILKI